MNKIVEKFKKNPMLYYACSIVASWAGVGSLMNFKTLATGTGAWSAIIWAVFNSLACIVFGLIVEHVPHLRKVMKTGVMFKIIAIMTIFQAWMQMSGIHDIFEDTAIGGLGGMIIAWTAGTVFTIMLYKRGMIRNALTDAGSWILVYGLLLVVTIASLIYTNGAFNTEISFAWEAPIVKSGIINGLLLWAGPFTYPYYYEIYEYNDHNDDGTRHINNVKTSFILAGTMFGCYMIFAALIAWTQFSPMLNFVKAVLIAIVAISSLSTYLYSTYLAFGKKAGSVLNAATVIGWYWLIPMGVMGIWQFIAKIRWIVVVGAIIVAIAMGIMEKVKKKNDIQA